MGFVQKRRCFMRILAFYAVTLVFIVISLVLLMRFLECITSRYENFFVFPCNLRCFRVFYVVLMKNGKKWQNIVNGGG